MYPFVFVFIHVYIDMDMYIYVCVEGRYPLSAGNLHTSGEARSFFSDAGIYVDIDIDILKIYCR